MIYRELLNRLLNEVSEEQLDSDVTIYDEQEDTYFPADFLEATHEDDQVDVGHPYFKIIL